MKTSKHRYQIAKRITTLGALANAWLGIMKLIGGFFYSSHALVADGLHSISDLMIDCMVLIASKYGSQDADEEHPYGHQRIETAATLFLALMLVLAGAAIAWDALGHFWTESHPHPSFITLSIAIMSVVLNEILFFTTRKIGHSIHSAILVANAWHHRSDSAASAIVCFGIIGSFFGKNYLDAMAAVIVGCMIIKMGVDYGWNSVKELIDTAINPEQIKTVEHILQNISGVKKIHQLRSRRMGHDIFIDVHVLVNPQIAVSEGHYIAQNVHYLLKKRIPAIKDVTVHIDPEDDELYCPSMQLPDRLTLEKLFLVSWKKEFVEITDYVVHYLDGKLIVDIFYAKEPHNIQQLKQQTKDIIARYSYISAIRLYLLQSTTFSE